MMSMVTGVLIESAGLASHAGAWNGLTRKSRRLAGSDGRDEMEFGSPRSPVATHSSDNGIYSDQFWAFLYNAMTL